MPYVITFVDDKDTMEKKKDVRPAHLEYVTSQTPRIMASGGFFPDHDDFPNGGLIILNVETREEAVSYIENDPFFLNGIFSTYTIHRWKKFAWDFKRAQ